MECEVEEGWVFVIGQGVDVECTVKAAAGIAACRAYAEQVLGTYGAKRGTVSQPSIIHPPSQLQQAQKDDKTLRLGIEPRSPA
jgi:hypothetical protein